ncbi:type II toxin-antitoxin system Phd/YefM family antitoxin [Tessaracoccus caeni]|uniref:type II toxin-antitoxin system Phd/YefM family antitoxin n=1 Tax=Tessaracoccus caeni TaxID=3031239 RepID=UPI0023DC8BC6|nr:type II toxin-antitoxin system prevent-host-death family antitoxin [Tessaracoccus caeni]MDF1486883.1 type II toxin-antitoxin system prevent-host-death family antitoxin [Tessaracoccus caeni]
MTTVNMHEAKSTLSALVERALAGERITIARAGKPAVDLVPHVAGADIVFGAGKGEFVLDTEIFDGVDAEIQEMFYGADA